MIRLILARLLQALAVLVFVAAITFVLIHLAPGDPFTAAVDNPALSQAVRDQWKTSYGLDKPLPVQFVKYVSSVSRGDFGWSFSKHLPVSEVIATALPWTLALMGSALFLGFLLGALVGRIQAGRRGSLIDRSISGVSLFFYSMPDFWLALIVLMSLAYWNPVFPPGGAADPLHDYFTPFARWTDTLKHMVLPVATLTLVLAATVSRFHRSALVETLPADFVRTARAKGLGERTVLRRHAERNALFPLISLVGLALPALFTGAVFVEKIFAWPGMGLVIVNAIGSRDYPLVMGTVIIASVLVALGNLITDLLYMAADPRVRLD
ncbi:MAG: ABC transporter permease [Gemmatimonadaceae bacterium]|nr:ABC transporter permease [Gemmatimonadaceae bacterium]